MGKGTLMKQGGPRPRVPNKPAGSQINLNLAEYQISFNKEAFTQFIKSQGIKMIHYRAIPDPRGKASRGDNHAVSAGVPRSSDGFIYKEAGHFKGLFSVNSTNYILEAEGAISYSMANITMPDTYEDSDQPLLVTQYDRFYFVDIEVRVIANQELEANSTGIDRLQYPATCVEHLIDADGNEYTEKVDFDITDEGFIKWTTQRRPNWDVKTQRGKVYSIRYRYTPFFVVERLLHEIRVSQITNVWATERTLERMPYQVLVRRENVFQDKNNDNERNRQDNRFQNAPAVGGNFGPTEPGINPSGNLGSK